VNLEKEDVESVKELVVCRELGFPMAFCAFIPLMTSPTSDQLR
jgi:hypothetical protein